MRYFIIAVVAVIALIIAYAIIAGIATEALWFGALGFDQVYWKIFWTKTVLWVVGAVVAGLWFGLNFRSAAKIEPVMVSRQIIDLERILPRGSKPVWWLAGLATVLLAMAYGASAAGHWREVLAFLNRKPFGEADPIFNRDASFYTFTLPVLNAIRSAALSMGIVAAIGVFLIGYVGSGGGPYLRAFLPAVRKHLLLLGAFVMVVAAFGFWLGRYGLLLTSSGVVFGPGYADVHAKIPALTVMVGLCLVSAVLLVVSTRGRGLRPVAMAAGVFILGSILALGIFPRLVQGIVVGPNELQKEAPYIKNNIRGTRLAYKIDGVDEVPFEASDALTAEDIRKNDATIRNARLWDWRPLKTTYSQIQEIRLYYDFFDADVDRYVIEGSYRQVLLSLRELNYRQIPARAATWVNTHLKYTHGYGLCMSPVDQVTPEGLPELFIKDIPPVSEVDLKVDDPAIYYGELSTEYALVRTTTEEFDYPLGEQNKFTTYQGTGGVPIGSLGRRLLFAWRFKDLKLLLTGYLTSESRIMFRRELTERVPHIAKFLVFDRDPYPVLLNGRVLWVWDAYTVTNMYPYSEPYAAGMNYIRNSVKAVVDVYNGSVSFYVSDPSDPLIQTYSAAFPSLFKSLDEMPAGLREHLRYPVDLFEIQGRMFASYHMQDPQVFYNKEDQWAVPIESYGGEQRRMESYYVIMKIPGEQKEEFILMLPFTPTNKDNMVAWLAARCDGANYGKLMVFLFPKQKLVFGPRQIEARIDQSPDISELLTLWSQKGSRVIRGNLLVIPIEQSLLYVEPLYILAEEGELPELKRVIVAFGGKIAMAQNLPDALSTVFNEDVTASETLGEPGAVEALEESVINTSAFKEALATFRRAQDDLRNGRWAEYGKEMDALGKLLDQLASGRGDNQARPAEKAR
jgi:uncharacterized membrane protein (UPF0182 family)